MATKKVTPKDPSGESKAVKAAKPGDAEESDQASSKAATRKTGRIKLIR